jgi:hypothetical protein
VGWGEINPSEYTKVQETEMGQKLLMSKLSLERPGWTNLFLARSTELSELDEMMEWEVLRIVRNW